MYVYAQRLVQPNRFRYLTCTAFPVTQATLNLLFIVIFMTLLQIIAVNFAVEDSILSSVPTIQSINSISERDHEGNFMRPDHVEHIT